MSNIFKKFNMIFLLWEIARINLAALLRNRKNSDKQATSGERNDINIGADTQKQPVARSFNSESFAQRICVPFQCFFYTAYAKKAYCSAKS